MEQKVTDLQENSLNQATKAQADIADLRGEHQKKLDEVKIELEQAKKAHKS